jgi:hypothetical protein
MEAGLPLRCLLSGGDAVRRCPINFGQLLDRFLSEDTGDGRGYQHAGGEDGGWQPYYHLWLLSQPSLLGRGLGDNLFDQPNSFEIRSGTGTSPSALIFNSGYKTYPYLWLKYGYGQPMKLDLAARYDRIRVNFDGANQRINLNIEVFSNGGSLYSEIGCNVLGPDGFMKPFSADFPFKNFTPGNGTPGADFKAVTNMIFEFGESQGPNKEADYAVTSIQVLKSDPQPAFTCDGQGH